MAETFDIAACECGGEAKLICEEELFRIECQSCHKHTAFYSKLHRALKAWDMVYTKGQPPIPALAQSGSALDAKHYQILQQQPIEIMQTLMTPEQFIGFLWGNVIKYTLRCGSKDAPVKEMEKAQQYARWYVEACEGKTIDPRE